MRPADTTTGASAGRALSALHVTDGRTRARVEIPTRHGVLRLRISPSCAGAEVDVSDLRVLVTGDVLMRAVEADGVQVVHVVSPPALPEPQSRTLRRAVRALDLHARTATDRPADVRAVFDGPADVYVAASRSRGERGVWIEVGQVQPAPSGTIGLSDAIDVDALALRLALLDHRADEDMSLDPDRLARAATELAGWRRRVAHWACSPSRPVPDGVRHRSRAALADGLSTRGVLAVLRSVETAGDIPDGAKFETFALLDRVLGLELIRDVGRV